LRNVVAPVRQQRDAEVSVRRSQCLVSCIFPFAARRRARATPTASIWLFLGPPSRQTVERKLEWGFAASPLIVDGVVYAADLGGRVHAFDARVGDF